MKLSKKAKAKLMEANKLSLAFHRSELDKFDSTTVQFHSESTARKLRAIYIDALDIELEIEAFLKEVETE